MSRQARIVILIVIDPRMSRDHLRRSTKTRSTLKERFQYSARQPGSSSASHQHVSRHLKCSTEGKRDHFSESTQGAPAPVGCRPKVLQPEPPGISDRQGSRAPERLSEDRRTPPRPRQTANRIATEPPRDRPCGLCVPCRAVNLLVLSDGREINLAWLIEYHEGRHWPCLFSKVKL